MLTTQPFLLVFLSKYLQNVVKARKNNLSSDSPKLIKKFFFCNNKAQNCIWLHQDGLNIHLVG